MKKLVIVIGIIGVVVGLGYFATQGHKKFEHHGFMEEIERLESHNLDYDQHIDSTAFIKVHSELEGVLPFFTELRTKSIVSYPCQNCHSVDISKLESEDPFKKAHWNVEMAHAGATVMNCFTCHNRQDLDQLNFLTGAAVSLDKSFEVCAQCHSSQYGDWQGGAHGKNLSGWKDQRVVKTCVSCHDPHTPHLENRWPSRLNKAK